MNIKFMSNNSSYNVEKVGTFTPKPNDIDELKSGEIGFIITGIKSLSETKVGTQYAIMMILLLHHSRVLNLANQLFLWSLFSRQF